MANQEHVDLLKQGVAQWNEWRGQHIEIWPDLDDANLSIADLSGADLSSASLRSTDLSGANLYQANLNGASLLQAKLNGAYLYKANVSGANLSDTNWFQADLREVDLQKAFLSGADLSWANLSKADLSEAILHKAKLSQTDLSGANLRGVYLYKANLSGANLNDANLSNANLGNTSLFGATLRDANLREADLSFAILDGADLSSAKIRWTTIADMDLRKAKGLAEIQHEGPSPVALYSVQLPQDGSALHFLRGAGVPDEWINDYRVHMMHPIQYHSCFISYSNRDNILARRLHADLQDHGVRCWFAPEDLKIGDKFRQRIDEAIHLQDKLLLLLSEHSIASTWVENEVEAALEREDRQQREVMFSICLDNTVMQTSKAWAATLRRTRHVGDFTDWTNPEAYRQAFNDLLRDLKAESKTRGE